MPPARKDRLPELDLLRVAALLGVLIIHAGAWITPADAPAWTNAMAAVSELGRFCVPAFVFASGFALYTGYGGQALNASEFLRKRWLRTLVPWLCCIPLFLALDMLRRDPAPDAAQVADWLLSGAGHLYFLLLIAQLYAVFPLLAPGGRRLRWITVGLVMIQLALMAWRSYGPLVSGVLGWPAIEMSHEEAPFWAGTFALGCLAASEWPRLSRLDHFWPLTMVAAIVTGWLVLAEGWVIGGAAWHQGTAAYLWPSRFLQAIVWSLALLWLGRHFRATVGKTWPAVRRLSQHSLGLYLLHPVVLEVFGPRTDGVPAPLRVAFLMSASLAGGYLAVGALAHTRLTAAAIGEQLIPARSLPTAT